MSQRGWFTLLVTICALLGVMTFAYGVGQTGSDLEMIVFVVLAIAFLAMSFVLSQRARQLPE
jgi:FtsH-binding integral membrane protein